MKCVVALLLFVAAAFAALADLTSDCQHVAKNSAINPYADSSAASSLMFCFLAGEIPREQLDALFNNLEVIRDTYVFADVASVTNVSMTKVNFAKELSAIKDKFYRSLSPEPPRIYTVMEPVMHLISSLQDGHVSLTVSQGKNLTNLTAFANVVAKLPFEIEMTYLDNNTRTYYAKNPDCRFFRNNDDCNTIKNLYNAKMPLDMVDRKDPYEFLTYFVDDYNWMRSTEGREMLSMDLVKNGIPLLRYPLFEDLVDWTTNTHTLSITESYHSGAYEVKTFNFKFAVINNKPVTARDVPAEEPKEPITIFSQEQERNNIDVISKFKKPHTVRGNTYVACGTETMATNKSMNYLTITSFAYEGNKATAFLGEVQGCIAEFEKNEAPITVILPHNTGGSYSLAASTMFLLMPSTDFRSLVAMRHNNVTFDLAARVVGNQRLSYQANTCRPIETFKELYQFWEKSETDDLGGGISHVRTPKLMEGYKDYIKALEPYALKHTRKPTEIFLATDGYCLDACAKFVQTIVQAGAATPVGFGPYNKTSSFTSAMYASGVIDPSIAISAIANNAAYGFNLRVAVTEDYAVSESQSDAIPLEHQANKVYKHIGFNKPFTANSVNAILKKIYPIYEDFNKQSKCDSAHPKLLLIDDECKPATDFATLGGYACAKGSWDKTTCKAAACEGGYVVDFETGKCVPNPCDSRYVAPSSSTSSQIMSSSEIDLSSSSVIKPVMAIVAVALVALFHLVH